MNEKQHDTSYSVEYKDVLYLSAEHRALERVRLVRGMKTIVGEPDYPCSPVDFVGDASEAIAFLDLVWSSFDKNRLAVWIIGDTPGLRADMDIVNRLENGLIAVKGGDTPTAIIIISRENDGTFHCRFGYSSKGASLNRGTDGSVKIQIENAFDLTINETLFKVYEMTGNPNLIETLSDRTEMLAKGESRSVPEVIDPEAYYATLGLNPYVLRFMSEGVLQHIIKGIKRELGRKLHGDTRSEVSEYEKEYIKKAMEACDVLYRKDKRDSYTNWL